MADEGDRRPIKEEGPHVHGLWLSALDSEGVSTGLVVRWATLRTQDGWPDVYCANPAALPPAFETNKFASRQISPVGNIAVVNEELGAGNLLNDKSVASRGIIKFHLASHVKPKNGNVLSTPRARTLKGAPRSLIGRSRTHQAGS